MRSFLALLVVLAFVADVSAQSRRQRRQMAQQSQWSQQDAAVVGSTVLTTNPAPTSPPSWRSEESKAAPAAEGTKSSSQSDDALDEVNAARAQRGLRPYINDPLLNEAARKCAAYRASIRCAGHCPGPRGDFAFLSPSVNTNGVAGGCAAWESGFGACAMYDNYTYCGAAWVRGSDGLKYCHIFVK